jgi:hypothetical protein
MSTATNVRLEAGQTFLLPLLDGTYTLGQVAFSTYVTKTLPVVATAFFPHRNIDQNILRGIASDPANIMRPIMVLMPAADELRHDVWPIIGKQPVAYANFDTSRRVNINGCDGESGSSGLIVDRVEMYWGILPWDHYGPGVLEHYLLDGFQAPPYPAHARFKKDFTEEELVRLADSDRARIRENLKRFPKQRGPHRTIHIQYAYEGPGLPWSNSAAATPSRRNSGRRAPESSWMLGAVAA